MMSWLPRWDKVCATQVLPMRVGPFAFRYQGNGATPCQYIDTTRKAIDGSLKSPCWVLVKSNWTSFYSVPQCSHCKRCTSYGNSICLSVRLSITRRYCVKTTACSTVQFALSDSKMCLVLQKLKNIPQGRPNPLKSWLELTYPLLIAARHCLPCSASTWGS